MGDRERMAKTEGKKGDKTGREGGREIEKKEKMTREEKREKEKV